jgi:hypothetical protein
MSHIIHNILQLETEINQEKIRLKEAIRNGTNFDEVKKIMLGLKELRENLDSCLAKAVRYLYLNYKISPVLIIVSPQKVLDGIMKPSGSG